MSGEQVLKLFEPKRLIDLLFLSLYVVGAVLLIYAIMQFVHAFEAKDKAFFRRGIIFLLISIVLLISRLIRSLF